MSIVEAHKVERFSHKIVQIHPHSACRRSPKAIGVLTLGIVDSSRLLAEHEYWSRTHNHERGKRQHDCCELTHIVDRPLVGEHCHVRVRNPATSYISLLFTRSDHRFCFRVACLSHIVQSAIHQRRKVNVVHRLRQGGTG